MEQSNLTSPSEYPQAVRSIQGAKNILWLLVGICIVLQLVVFVLVGVVGMLDALHSPRDATSQVAGAKDTVDAVAEARYLEESVFRMVLSSTRFLVMVFMMILVVTLLVGVLVSLVGRLGGAPHLLSAFFWSVLLLAVLTPWQQIIQEFFCPGATFNIDELVRWTRHIRAVWGAESPEVFAVITYYVRFVAYPLLALAIWGVVQLKCSRGFGQMALKSVSSNY